RTQVNVIPMRPVRAALVVLLVGAGHSYLAAQDLPPSSVVIFDRDMTPASGTSDLLALQHALIFVEDRFLPAQFDETTSLRRTVGIAYRFGKWFALDLPQDHFLMVVAHEVFGHGARLREIGATDIHYHFDMPIPYGPGGGSTAFNGDLSATRADVLAIDTAGIEAQNVTADWIGRQAFARGALTYRESWTY